MTEPLIGLRLGRVAHLELVNPPLNLITRELLLALDDALSDARGRAARARCARWS